MGTENFCDERYYVDTFGRNKEQIAEYIRKQIKEDYSADQLMLFEEVDLFTGAKMKRDRARFF